MEPISGFSAKFNPTYFIPKRSSHPLQRVFYSFYSNAKMTATSASPPSGTASINTSRANTLIQIPRFVYGTAWKKDRTTELVFEALRAGFKGLDTAAQPRHYREDEVGAAVRMALGDDIIKREDIHVQLPSLTTLPYSTHPADYCV